MSKKKIDKDIMVKIIKFSNKEFKRKNQGVSKSEIASKIASFIKETVEKEEGKNDN